MAFWKQKYNRTDGFSLVEIVVAITILGFVAVPMFTGLLFSYQLNQRSDEKMQAQLAVSNAVETIMAEGYNNTDTAKYDERFQSVIVSPPLEFDENGNEYEGSAIRFTVTSTHSSDIAVTTYARPYQEGGGT